MKIERMEEAALYQVAITQATKKLAHEFKSMDLVDISLTGNAYAAGFYMGARYVETPRRLVDIWPLPKRVRRLHPFFDRDRPAQAAQEYIDRHFKGARAKDDLLIRSAAHQGFKGGAEFMWGWYKCQKP